MSGVVKFGRSVAAHRQRHGHVGYRRSGPALAELPGRLALDSTAPEGFYVICCVVLYMHIMGCIRSLCR